MPSASISKTSIQKYLSNVKLDDVDSLREFALRLQNVCTDTKLPTRAAASLTLIETFRFFNFGNEILYGFGFEKIVIPSDFTVTKTLVTDSEAFLWLKSTLDKIGGAWNIRTEATRRLYIEMVTTAAIHETRAEASHKPLPLHGFCELPLSCMAQDPDTGAPTIISGRCDVGIGYGSTTGTTISTTGTTTNSLAHPGLETILILVEAKTEATLENAFPQLLAYMGIIAAAREEKTNSTVYGIYSDGMTYTFVRLDNNRMVSKSRPLTIVDELDEVFAFMVHLLSSAMESSPTCSPAKPGGKRDKDLKGFATRVEPKYFVIEPFEESGEAGDDLMEDIVVLSVRGKENSG